MKLSDRGVFEDCRICRHSAKGEETISVLLQNDSFCTKKGEFCSNSVPLKDCPLADVEVFNNLDMRISLLSDGFKVKTDIQWEDVSAVYIVKRKKAV